MSSPIFWRQSYFEVTDQTKYSKKKELLNINKLKDNCNIANSFSVLQEQNGKEGFFKCSSRLGRFEFIWLVIKSIKKVVQKSINDVVGYTNL